MDHYFFVTRLCKFHGIGITISYPPNNLLILIIINCESIWYHTAHHTPHALGLDHFYQRSQKSKTPLIYEIPEFKLVLRIFNPLCVVLVGYVGFDYTIYLARSCLQLYVFNNGYCMSPT